MIVSLGLIVVLTVLGWWISERFQFGRQLGTTMVVLLIGFLVINLFGWQPHDDASGWISGPLTSLAITQLLLAVDLRRLWPDARRLMAPFVAAVVFTLIGVIAGASLLQPWLGSNQAVLGGIYMATFTGGSLNFVSVARALNPPASLLLVATAADHVVFALWFAISVLIGHRWVSSQASTSQESSSQQSSSPSVHASTSGRSDRWSSVGWSLIWSGAVLGLAELLTSLVQTIWSSCPSILVLTSLALLAAQLPGSASREGCYSLGLLLIQPFFTVIGLSSPLAGLFGQGWPVFAYASVVVAVHGIGVLGVRRWRRWPLAETLVASQAAIGGPSTALALASSMGRGALALPSVAIGLLGYLVGTYLGLMAAGVLSGF